MLEVRIARRGTRRADGNQITKVLRSPAKMFSISNATKGFRQRDKILFAGFKISVWLLCKEWIRGEQDW